MRGVLTTKSTRKEALQMSEIKFRFKETKGRPGAKIIGTIVSVKGRCWMGQKVGGTFELSGDKTNGML